MKQKENEKKHLPKKITVGAIVKIDFRERFQTLFDTLEDHHYDTRWYQDWHAFLESNDKVNIPKLYFADITLFEHIDFSFWQSIRKKLKREDAHIIVAGDFNKKALINITALQDGLILDFVFFPININHFLQLNLLYAR
jgi:hypothetical protein